MAEYENIIDLDKLGRFHSNLKDKGLPLNDWRANKEYKVGYTVIQDGKLYRCKTEHTSTTTFDDTKWSVVSSSGIPSDSYSTEEKLIGTWIDGKPLYRKVFENPASSGVSTGLTSSVCSVKKVYGFGIDMNGFGYSIPYASAVGPWAFETRININSGVLSWSAYYGSSDLTSQCSCPYVVIEYAKN